MSQDLPHLIWVDCEMTGLDINKDALVEIAVLVTDARVAEAFSVRGSLV